MNEHVRRTWADEGSGKRQWAFRLQASFAGRSVRSLRHTVTKSVQATVFRSLAIAWGARHTVPACGSARPVTGAGRGTAAVLVAADGATAFLGDTVPEALAYCGSLAVRIVLRTALQRSLGRVVRSCLAFPCKFAQLGSTAVAAGPNLARCTVRLAFSGIQALGIVAALVTTGMQQQETTSQQPHWWALRHRRTVT
jgi:hypothetical protein